jgi:methionyl-tRNA formyltransferase
MRISLVCSEPNHPVMASLEAWRRARASSHEIELVHRLAELGGGDLLLLISCHEIVRPPVRARYRSTLG